MSVTAGLLAALVIGAVLGGGVRLVLGKRSHLGVAASVLSGIAGAAFGTAVVSIIEGDPESHHPAWALAASVIGTLVVLLAATQLTASPPPTAAQLIAAGESETVEFKSSARYNLRTEQRDERLELVIAKTVCGLANGKGGALLVGVDDDGRTLGLAEDLTLMKQPDSDRYELWLRDFLGRTLGGGLTATLAVSFPEVSGSQICLVRVPASARPVFLTPGKGAGPELWVRSGNSTRQLPIDQALAYSIDRWGRRGLRGAA
jgi:uncharacterized membrane protein YeaQ/YmgE (transglycosylase-associated protein family)